MSMKLGKSGQAERTISMAPELPSGALGNLWLYLTATFAGTARAVFVLCSIFRKG